MQQNRIISGMPAATGQFPWQVILKKDEMDDLLCGASIISNSWVLTAAHCTYGLDSIYMQFGTNQLDDDNALSMTSTQMFIHPEYNPSNLNNDISLIQLPTALNFSTNIQPINLIPSSQANNNFIGTVATIAGYGLVDDEYLENSPVLLYAQMNIINNSACTSIFGSDVVISSTLCAQAPDGTNQSICSGDSGGPLLVTDSSGNYMQIGINSFVAKDMCSEGYPAGFGRLSSFLDFVRSTTGINFS